MIEIGSNLADLIKWIACIIGAVAFLYFAIKSL